MQPICASLFAHDASLLDAGQRLTFSIWNGFDTSVYWHSGSEALARLILALALWRSLNLPNRDFGAMSWLLRSGTLSALMLTCVNAASVWPVLDAALTWPASKVSHAPDLPCALTKTQPCLALHLEWDATMILPTPWVRRNYFALHL